MAVTRQGNFLSQMRIDVPDMRALESAIAYDFDVLGGRILGGTNPVVVKGFTISTAAALGVGAETLQMSVGGGTVLHFGASEAGSVFYVPASTPAETLAGTNPKVVGSFTSGTTNYVGIDLRRTADSTTADSTKFRDANTGLEITKTVPKARILSYVIMIGTSPFSVTTNVAPVAIVVTDASNNIVSVTDARRLMFRLGAGGDSPSATSYYSWSNRSEDPIQFSSSSPSDPFAGGDKQIGSMKEWMDAVMTRLWELGSGRYWYAPTARDAAKLVSGSPVLGSNSDNFDFNSGTNTVSWSGLSVVFENSFADNGTGVFKNTITAGSATILDGQALYVDLQRGTIGAALTPAVANLTALVGPGSPSVPGSRYIIAWRVGSLVFTRDRPYEIGRALNVATTSNVGVVKIRTASATPLAPVTLSDGDMNWMAVNALLNNLSFTNSTQVYDICATQFGPGQVAAVTVGASNVYTTIGIMGPWINASGLGTPLRRIKPNGVSVVTVGDVSGGTGFTSIARSTDAVTFSAITNTSTHALKGLDWSPTLSKWCAVGASGQVVTFTDSNTPTLAYATAGSGTLNAVAWGNGIFVAMGATGTTYYTSTDGSTWNTATFPTTLDVQNGRELWFSSYLGKFFCSATNGAIYSSSTGLTSSWTLALAPNSTAYPAVNFQICDNGFALLAVGSNNGTGTVAFALTSYDGVTWTYRILRNGLASSSGTYLLTQGPENTIYMVESGSGTTNYVTQPFVTS